VPAINVEIFRGLFDAVKCPLCWTVTLSLLESMNLVHMSLQNFIPDAFVWRSKNVNCMQNIRETKV
jgi:hypothetical protein